MQFVEFIVSQVTLTFVEIFYQASTFYFYCWTGAWLRIPDTGFRIPNSIFQVNLK